MVSAKMKGLVLGSSAIREMFEVGKQLKAKYGAENVFDFSLGNPSALPPKEVKQALEEVLSKDTAGLHGYMNNCGHDDVRDAIAQHINAQHGTSFTHKNVVMSIGAAGGINILLKTIIDPRDEVVVFAPFFAEYQSYITNYDAEMIVAQTDTKTFIPDLNNFEKLITPKTKAVIINSPNNPTGVVYSDQTIKAIADILNKKQAAFNTQIFLIADEPYRQLVYDNTPVPFVPLFYQNTFVVYSFSKSLSLPGERIGYVLIPSEIDSFDETTAAISVATRILGFVNAPALFQQVIKKCVGVNVDMTEYTKNRNLLYETFTRLGFECVKPQGGFYVFPKALNGDGKSFCEAAKKHNLLFVPGSAFNCQTHFRLAFCVPHEMIQRAVPKIEALSKEF